MVTAQKIEEWNAVLWKILKDVSPKLRDNCNIEEEIINDGGIWVDKFDSELVQEPRHFLRVQMRYEGDFHFGVVETDDENDMHALFEEGKVEDDSAPEEKLQKALELLSRYGCIAA